MKKKPLEKPKEKTPEEIKSEKIGWLKKFWANSGYMPPSTGVFDGEGIIVTEEEFRKLMYEVKEPPKRNLPPKIGRGSSQYF